MKLNHLREGMKESIYLETTIVSYYTSRASRDVVVAGHQQITKDFIEIAQNRYEIFISEIVLDECKNGDDDAAKFRMEFLERFKTVELNESVLVLAKTLVTENVIPKQYGEDALHISLATIHGIDYLVSWNCKHIANAHIRTRLENIIQKNGYVPPVICTPEELME